MTYTEDALVEQPAINLFSEVGWQTFDCYSETFGEDSLLGRDNRSEVILVQKGDPRALPGRSRVYGGGSGGVAEGDPVDSPAEHKEALRIELERAVSDSERWLAQNGVSLDKIINASTKGFEKPQLLDEASELMLKPDLKPEFTGRVRQVNRLFKAVMPDTRALEFIKQRVVMNVIYAQMKHKSGEEIDDSDVLDVVRHQVNELLDESIETIYIGSNLPDPVDISNIDFDALGEMVKRTTKPRLSDVERLKNLIELKIAPMVERNRTRQDLQEKFKNLIDEYNNGAYSAE